MLELGHLQLKVEWRSVTTTSGALSVMTLGAMWMLVLLAFSWATAMKVVLLIMILFVGFDYVPQHSGATAQRSATYGQGTGPVQLSQVLCSGSENSITSCPSSAVGVNCQHNQDAGVTCVAREFYENYSILKGCKGGRIPWIESCCPLPPTPFFEKFQL